MEMVAAILYQLTRNLSVSEIKESGFDAYFVDHTTGIYPAAASGPAFTADYLQSTGDPLADMLAVYDYLHKKHIEQVAEIKRYQDVYKSM